MNRPKKIIIAIVCILIFFIAAITLTQWENIKVLSSVGKHSTEEIEQMLDENVEKRKTALADINIRELTSDEKLAVQKGELSEAAAIKLITENEVFSKQNQNTENVTVNGNKTASETTHNYEVEISELIGQIYVLEANFSGSVAGLLDSAIAEYKSLPDEMHTNAKKWEIGLKYLGVATSMEASCDSQMASILSKLESALISAGKDTALLGEIKSAYQSEKVLTKDYYLSLYS